MKRDYLASFAAEALAVALSLLVYRVAATQWPPETFGEYALSRKILSGLLVVALVGMDTAVVRFVAYEAGGRLEAGRGYLVSALRIAGAASIALVAALFVFADPLAAALYGGAGHAAVLPAMGLVCVGGALYGVAYGYERAQLRIGHAAVLLVLVTGLGPLVGILALPATTSSALAATGVAWIVAGGGMVLARVRPAPAAPAGPLLRYGAPRSAGLLLQMALLAVPAIVAANRFGIVEAGNVAFALLVLGFASTLLTPIGVVLMPRSAHLLRERAAGELRRHVATLVLLVVPGSALLALGIQAAADPLVALYLGPGYADAAPTLRALIWAAVPWSLFVTLRGLIDASDLRPLNALNVLAATAVYAALLAYAAAARLDEAAYHAAFVAAVIVLGILSVIQAWRALARHALAQPVVEDALQP